MRIFVGLIGCALAVLLIVYRVRVHDFIGQIGWAERHLGAGGTYTLLLLVGVFMFFFSLMYMTDSFNVLFGGINVDFFGSI